MGDALNQRELFEGALAVPVAERERWLLAHCQDSKKRAEVEELIAADQTGELSILDTPFEDFLGKIDRISASEYCSVKLGSFSIIERIAEGSLSISFRARRGRANFTQEVTLTLLRYGIYSREERHRFQERGYALSKLQHPAVVRCITSDITDMGIPFAVTELVEGMPITYFAATKSLSINDRLFLFIDVCRAVDDAHRAQIVHGSLQPRNILVTKKREVKLQGFAFSELIGPHEDDSKGSATILAAVYKAPELFSGSCTAIASDVYALGILLEELVALMHRHHPARNRPFGEVEDFYAARLVGGVNDQIATSFGDDLNHVILKATALLPEERYQSAGSVADEVERFLSRKHARDGDQSKLNSARLFFRQNWGVVLIITFYFGAMIATLTAILYYLI